MSTLPWDRFADEEPPDEPELPYVPPPPLPVPPPVVVTPPPPIEEIIDPEPPPPRPEPIEDIDLGSLANEAFKAALNEALPGLKQNALDMLRASIQATVKGQEVDWARPLIKATTEKGHELVVADAKSRSWRTLLQGLGIDLIAGLVAVVATLSGADLLNKETWILFGALLIKTVIQTIVSYFMRLKVTPTIKNKEGEKMALMPIPRPLTKAEQEDRAV